jgi:hypothetical protein
MNPFLKDLIQVASWTVAVIGGLTAALVAIRQLKLNTQQRKTELRWKQANAAKEIIDDIHNNNWAKNAVAMLDWSEGKHRFRFEGGNTVEISYENDVLAALTKKHGECSDLEQDIIYCFDWFFYFINRIEHYIRTELIKFEDVEDVFNIYGEKIKQNEQVFENFMQVHSYRLAVDFWKRHGADL